MASSVPERDRLNSLVVVARERREFEKVGIEVLGPK